MSIVQEYLDLTKKYKADYGEKTILLMQVGSFLEVYALINPDGTYTGSNIEEFAKINEMVIAKKNVCVGKMPVVMAGVGVAYIDKYIQKLQEHSYTIVIYKQDMNGKNTTRSLSEIISPGTFFPAETEHLSNNVMSIWLHKSNTSKLMPAQVTVGIANIDIYTGKTSLFQFASNYAHTPATYDELERYISAYRPSECLFVANMPEKLVADIIGFVGLENTKIHKVDLHQAQQTHQAQQVKEERSMETYAKNAEKQIYQTEILKRFFPNLSSFYEMFPTHHIAMQSFCFLLDFVYQHSPDLVKKLSDPTFENYTDKLILANHSLHQLNIIDDTRHTGRYRSVGSLLNNCVTTMGKRHFLYKLHYPITNEVTLQASYDITEHMLAQGEANWLNIRNNLNSITDLEKFARKVVTRKIMPKNLACLDADLKAIGQLYEKTQADAVLLKHLKGSTLSNPEASIAVVGGMRSSGNPLSVACNKIRTDINRVFCLEACQNLSDINETSLIINKGISPVVDELILINESGKGKLAAICAYLSGLVQQGEKEKKPQQYVKIHETAKSNAVLIATTRRIGLLKDAIKKEKKTMVTLTYGETSSKLPKSSLGACEVVGTPKGAALSNPMSLGGETPTPFEFDLASLEYDNSGGGKNDKVITSKQIKEITSANETSKDKLVNEMNLIFQNYIVAFGQFDQEMEDIIKYTTEMDMLQCKCFIANKYNYCKPTISTEADTKSFFAFTDIRHPLIEYLQTNELYVTNDLALSGAHEEAAGVLLYGTNAVGKTSLIKSVGIAVIMAQAGLYVPCSSFTYKPYRNIFTRILGNDNLFKGLSTFAVEMTELRSILLLADEYSLVLGDELCSGTESDSALSIFTAGLEMLHEKNSTFLFATHFHEITKYEEIKNLTRLKMLHMAVHYNKETNVLVYDRKLREGPGESMYGLEVCKSLNLPEAFLQRAHDIRMKYCPEKQNILSLSPTHFNAKKLVGNCEICKNQKASEVHHLQHQKNANAANAYINTFHKNHVANLLNICENCHLKIHKSKEQHKVVKTTAGYKIVAI